MPKKLCLTELEQKAIKDLYKNGWNVNQLAKLVNRSYVTVYNSINREQPKSKKPPKKFLTLKELGADARCKLSDEEWAEVVKEYEHGHSLTELARAYHVSVPCVYYHVNPEYKKSMNERSQIWHALNISKERSYELSSRAYQKRKELNQKYKEEHENV